MNEKNLSFQIRLAERIIEIQPLYERIRFLCEDYICPEGTEPDLTIRITGEDLEREKASALAPAVCFKHFLRIKCLIRKICT